MRLGLWTCIRRRRRRGRRDTNEALATGDRLLARRSSPPRPSVELGIVLQEASGHRDSADNSHASSLTCEESRVLAALSRRPQGLRGVASVAAVAGVDHDEARSALGQLAKRRLVTTELQAARGAGQRRPVTVWRLLVGDAWFQVADAVRAVPLPPSGPAPTPDRLPACFEHLFWWGDPASIEFPRDVVFVAEHMLACHDIEAWGWAIATLPAAALERVAGKEHTPPQTRAMIRNALRARNGIPL